ncbi:DUF1365 family protein [Acinetobacter haemolyticus]|uniref:DUF1365 family protein n=2 Tax=Acinetobacter haemolyticus TaxID=29430 RepID=A0AAJ2YSR9_ACIHA|nr:DUF1365 domain-containing protein [Acinetobacter haemolyticus]EFF82237.1 hypothetical protein HMP0015_2299 [Acinetobacter haemolyticus ATCC 19194]NAR17804.1 DUF1365 family protein [Acinetobacter haemolyticus]NAR29208.1 DUF1365 family protein [Acinetobacter haemolyticus]NAR35614.1 DUF1365 family protein [Acinetobacter haemolyticus]NAR47315.1 DUF1365 family protein [Acinetobacter haemolyticus]
MLNSSFAIASAQIRHRRFQPKSHEFSTDLKYLWFDPEQLSDLLSQSKLCSERHWSLLNLYPEDFLTEQSGSIREKIKRIILQQTDSILPSHTNIRILALPRSLGFRFNSVVFYFIFDAQQQPLFILSEITNTPWNERKVYVHDCRLQAQQRADFQGYQFDFEKSFHVSPFMPMRLDYRWRFHFSMQQHVIYMQLYQQEQKIFDANMRFTLSDITQPSQLRRYAIYHVFEPFKMLAQIYLQAFRLWKKKVPFYRHPNKEKDRKEHYENSHFR